MSSRIFLLSAVAAGIGLQTLPAAAAEAPGAGQLEEVLVTARKREESILQVPVVATALTHDQLAAFATSSLYAVSDRVPGLLFGSGTGSFGAQVSLRGVGTATLNATIDQSVSLNIDGMQMTQGLAYKLGQFDMAQVEVLRGPQALYYGKSSPGGVISIHTANPTDEFEVIASGGYEFEANTTRGELILSGPVSDTLGLRLATQYSESDGFFENAAVATPGTGALNPRYRDFAPQKDWLTRATAVWKPTDRFSAQVKLNYMKSDRDGDGGGLQYASCPEGTASLPGVPPFLGGEDCKVDKVLRLVDLDPAAFLTVRNNGVPFSDIDQAFGTIELNYDFTNGLTLTSVTGYYELDQAVMINGTLGTSAGSTLSADTDFTRDDFTQELRLTSDFDTPLNFVVGAFYQDGTMKNRNNLLGNTALLLPIPGTALTFRPAALLNQGYHTIDIQAISGFGQLIWQVLPELELAAGARWTKEERDHAEFNTLTGWTPVRGAPAVPVGPVPLVNDNLESDNVSPEFTVTYRPTDSVTLFGSFKQAFKSGSFDSVTMKAPGLDMSFGDEEVKGYEAGIKTRLLDDTLAFNFAGYSYDYKDLQVGTNETNAGQIAIRTLNAATAEVYGVDMDVTYRVPAVRGLILNAAVNYNHARYGSFDTAPCYGGQTIALGCDRRVVSGTGVVPAQDLSDKPLMRAPEWSANLGFDYEIPVGNAMTLALAASALYSDEYYTNLLLRSDMVQDSFVKTSASVALRGARDAWEIALIGNNLGNELISGNCVNGNFANGIIVPSQVNGGVTSGPAGVDELACNVEPGREVWIRLTVKPLAFRQ